MKIKKTKQGGKNEKHAEYMRPYRMKRTLDKRKQLAVYKLQRRLKQKKNRTVHKYALYKQKRRLKQSTEQRGKHAAEMRQYRSNQT